MNFPTEVPPVFSAVFVLFGNKNEQYPAIVSQNQDADQLKPNHRILIPVCIQYWDSRKQLYVQILLIFCCFFVLFNIYDIFDFSGLSCILRL